MKNISCPFLFIIFSFTSFTSMHAATVTWLGGNDIWDNPTHWDTGTTPSYNDDVIIPSGHCRIYSSNLQSVRSIEVQSSARFYIHSGGALKISGATDNHGLHNMGRVYIYGNLDITDISQSSTSTSANAIRNEKYIYMYSNCNVEISDIDDIAIYTESANTYFRVRGKLSIHNVYNNAIYNKDRFYNYGTINIENTAQNNGGSIINLDHFRNYSTGVINLKSDGYSAISNSGSSPNFDNYGDINISKVSNGIINIGNFYNHSGANIFVEEVTSSAIYNRIGRTFTNDGYISALKAPIGITNYGNFINNNDFVVNYSGYNGGIRNYSTGVINNYNYIYLSAIGPRDINNDGNIYNHHGGHIEINKKLELSAGSNIYNYGFFVSKGSINHIMDGSFTNKGIVDDDHGKILPSMLNYRVVVAPVSTSMQAGVPFPNVLDVVSLDHISFGDWKVSQNGAIAGTYNANTNTFTPNSSAIGLSTLYIKIQDLISGNTRDFTLEIDSPILPFTRKNGISSARNEINEENPSLEAVDVRVYPNPTSGNIQLESDAFEFNSTQIQIYNSVGQLVQQERFNTENSNPSLDFSSELINGIYIMRVLKDGIEIDVKRIHLNR